MFGIAVSSSSPCVAARCAHARAGAGVVATQNITDPSLGPRGLDLMASGLSAAVALERLKATSPHIAYRQLALVDRDGGSADFSGDKTLGRHRSMAVLDGVTVFVRIVLPVRSAGMLLVRDVAWPIADLRIDWSDDPIGELAALWELWKPQMEAYVTRALDPGSAPTYGVEGDR